MITLQTTEQIKSIPTHREATTGEIKKYLQKKFNYKFSVTRKGGSSYIDIRWIDGPNGETIRKACYQFNDDSKDDIMTDLFIGSQYTLEHRSISAKAYLYAAWKYCKEWGYILPKITIRKCLDGTYDAWIDNVNDIKFDELRPGSSWYLSHAISHLAHSIDYREIFKQKD